LTTFEYYEKDPILAELAKNSVLTWTQLATYLSYQTNQHRTSKPKIYARFGQFTSKGVFHRILQQARKNIRRSVITIILLGYIDITDTTDITQDITELFELGHKISELREIVSLKDAYKDEKRAMELLSEILQKLKTNIK
jgi:hypothetical protein